MNLRILAALAAVWVGSLLLAALVGGSWLLLVLLSTEAFIMLMFGLHTAATRPAPVIPPHGSPSGDYPPPWRPPHDFPGDEPL